MALIQSPVSGSGSSCCVRCTAKATTTAPATGSIEVSAAFVDFFFNETNLELISAVLTRAANSSMASACSPGVIQVGFTSEVSNVGTQTRVRLTPTSAFASAGIRFFAAATVGIKGCSVSNRTCFRTV